MNVKTKSSSPALRVASGQRGAFLMIAGFLIAAAAMAAIGVTGYVQHQSKCQAVTEETTKAHYVARGAMNRVKKKFAESPDYLKNPTTEMQAGQIGEGSYTIAYKRLQDNVVCVETTGVCNSGTAVLRMYAKPPVTGAGAGFNKAIFSEQDVVLHGNGEVDTTATTPTVHSNSDSLAKGSFLLQGNLSAHGTASGSSKNVTGTVVSAADYEYFPALDYDFYYQIAKANKQVYPGGTKIGSDMSPPGGVIWVEGDVMVTKDAAIKGCLVAEGDIKTTSKSSTFMPGEIMPGVNAPALVSLNGDIIMTAQAELRGLVYAGTGSVKFTGSWKNGLKGAIYAWDTIEVTGGAGLTYDPEAISDLGGGIIVIPQTVKILALER